MLIVVALGVVSDFRYKHSRCVKLNTADVSNMSTQEDFCVSSGLSNPHAVSELAAVLAPTALKC